MATVEQMIILGLATTWVVLAVTRSDGAFGVFYKARQRFKLLDCHICLSIWVAMILYLLPREVSEVIAIAGIASVIFQKLW